ncbi:MAG: hypothetical protein GY756_08800, partial [bacterium]|nr:hypothetical protein [bacterium]
NLDNHKIVFSLYHDDNYQELFDWIVKDGKKKLMYFLIQHPKEALLFNEDKNALKKIFASNIGYTGGPKSISKLSQIFPLFSLISILILQLILSLICFKEKSNRWMFPLALIVIFTINVLLVYNIDKLEIERHLITTQIMIQFIGILLVVQILDSKTSDNYINSLVQKVKFLS